MAIPTTAVHRPGRRIATHPLATAVALLVAAAGTWLSWVVGSPFVPTAAWIVLALAAGYAVSGSV
jgi:hypothetical protein